MTALRSVPVASLESPVQALLPRTPATPIQFLSPDGTLTENGREARLDDALLTTMFRDMYLGRRLDHQALNLQRQGELGLWLMSLGQEASQVGSIRALRDTDYVFPSYREHVAGLCRGLTPSQLLSQWRGVVHAGWDWEKSRFHFYSLVLGSQTLHATGYAIGLKHDRVDDVVLTYVGDGATSQGDVNEALNWAAVNDAPIVFFCQNNNWAISTPNRAQYRGALHRRATGFGLRSYIVDGNDVMAVYEVTKAAVRHARSGGGPVFIEADTYRMAGHSTSDDPRRYRDDADTERWKKRDPITRLELHLRANGFDDDFFTGIQAEGDELAEATRKACLQLEEPMLEDLFSKVYAEPHPVMDQQHAERLRFVSTLEEAR